MDSEYNKTLDQIMSIMLTNYANLSNPPTDTSKGSEVFITSSVVGTQVWGLYQYMNFITRQIIPGVDNDPVWVLKHAEAYGVTVNPDDSDNNITNKTLDVLRFPRAGGNKHDYERWAIDSSKVFVIVDDVKYYNKVATIVPVYAGGGTVGVFTIPNDETVIDDGANTIEEDLRQATFDYIESVRPAPALPTGVASAKPILLDVSLQIKAGPSYDDDNTKEQVKTYVDNLKPGESFFASQAVCIALQNGAIGAEVTNPVNEETPIDYDKFYRAGAIITGVI